MNEKKENSVLENICYIMIFVLGIMQVHTANFPNKIYGTIACIILSIANSINYFTITRVKKVNKDESESLQLLEKIYIRGITFLMYINMFGAFLEIITLFTLLN